jgi:predicted alpha/beta superfamily hydrolase
MRDAALPKRVKRARPPGRFETLGDWTPPGFSRRVVTAYVPADHVRDGTRPALFLFDGQNVFDDTYSFAGGWFAHQAVDGLPRRTCNVPVVVGIPHGGEHRVDELVPWKMRQGGGHLSSFLAAVVARIVPEVQHRHGTLHGPLGAVLGGSSLGGLAALWGHLHHPHVFGGALALSPSLWVAGRAIFKDAERFHRPVVSRIYLDCGGREAGGRMLPVVREMSELLKAKHYPASQLKFRADERAQHNEKAWRRRLPGALRFMFRRG